MYATDVRAKYSLPTILLLTVPGRTDVQRNILSIWTVIISQLKELGGIMTTSIGHTTVVLLLSLIGTFSILFL